MSDWLSARVSISGAFIGGLHGAAQAGNQAKVTRNVNSALLATALFLQAEAQQLAPTGVTGDLQGGIKGELVADLQARVSSPSSYAQYIETGSRPHFPPPSELELWVQRKWGLSDEKEIKSGAFLLARAIFRRGTSASAIDAGGLAGPTGGDGYFFMARALGTNLAAINQRFFAPLGVTLVKELGG